MTVFGEFLPHTLWCGMSAMRIKSAGTEATVGRDQRKRARGPRAITAAAMARAVAFYGDYLEPMARAISSATRRCRSASATRGRSRK